MNMGHFEYRPVQPNNGVQVQTPIEVQPQTERVLNEVFWAPAEVQQALDRVPVTSRPLTKEEYELYNALPIWFNAQQARARAQRRNARKVL
jgi:hypothetical protein